MQSVSSACERQTVGCHSESRSSVGPSLSLSLSLVLRFVYISIPTVYLAWSRSADLYIDLLPCTGPILGRYICPFQLCICGHGSLYASPLSLYFSLSRCIVPRSQTLRGKPPQCNPNSISRIGLQISNVRPSQCLDQQEAPLKLGSSQPPHLQIQIQRMRIVIIEFQNGGGLKYTE